MYLKKVLAGSIAVSLASSLYAYEMKPVGFKAVGMGGTGVASTRGSLSGYYNPALLRMSDYTTEVSFNIGARIRETNLIDPVDELSNINFDTTLDNIGDNAVNGNVESSATISGTTLTLSDNSTLAVSTSVAAVLNALASGTTTTQTISGTTYTFTSNGSGNYTIYKDGTNNLTTDQTNIKRAVDIITKEIGTNNAFEASVNASFTAQISDAFALGVYGYGDGALRINIDSNYDKLITRQTNNNSYVYYEYDYDNDKYIASNTAAAKTKYETESIEYANDNGINYVQVDTLMLVEVPVSYARAYDWKSGYWSFGINAKAMSLETSTQSVKLGTSADEADTGIDNYTTTYKNTFGIDLGLAYMPKGSDLTVGLVGKNINSPSFKVDTSKTGRTADYEFDPYFRAGISYPIWNNNIEFALDVDLQKSETMIPGEDTQMVGAGIELHPASWFALRLGAMQDMASEKYDEGTILTAGVGFGLKWLQFDLSVMASTETGEYDGNEIPRYAAANLSLLSRWGDGYNQKQPPKYEGDYTENVAPTKILTDEKIEKMEKELDKETKEKPELDVGKLLYN